jgi:hypothetical protein
MACKKARIRRESVRAFLLVPVGVGGGYAGPCGTSTTNRRLACAVVGRLVCNPRCW